MTLSTAVGRRRVLRNLVDPPKLGSHSHQEDRTKRTGRTGRPQSHHDPQGPEGPSDLSHEVQGRPRGPKVSGGQPYA